MRLKFLGASGTVTGSAYLLSTEKTRVMVDFGMFQGTASENALNTRPLSFNPKEVGALFLTHAHLDHCGRIPLLVKNGFEGKIFTTQPTLDLVEIVLLDSAKIAESENPNGPLYTSDNVTKALSLFEVVEFGKKFEFRDLGVEFIRAGHIIGAASIRFTVGDEKIIFSGDLGTDTDPIINNMEYFDEANYVVMESTYGGREHPKNSPYEQILNNILSLRGTLLVPSFAIQKTQSVLCILATLKKEGKIKDYLPVFLDSPMAIRATKVYTDYPSELVTSEFTFPGLTMSFKGSQSRRIRRTNDPKVIIAGAGMMSGGRILGHAKKYLSNAKNRLLIVGYQAVETLGREIKEGARQVNIEGMGVPIHATVDCLESLSSHADEPKLLDWLGHIKGVKTLILTHGEDESRIAFASSVRRKIGIPDVKLPQLDEEVELE